MVLELEGAERVAYIFEGVALAVRKVIARVDVPDRAGARMAGVENTVDDGVAQVDVRRRHVDFRTEHPLAVPELACAHPREQLCIFLHAAVAERAVPARARQCAPALSNIVDGLVVDVCLSNVDEMAGPGIELLEIVGGKAQAL